MRLFDANTWLGPWPFAAAPLPDAVEQRRRLRRAGIDRALVSPLAAALAPTPRYANAALLEATAGIRELEPVPVINPSLPNWEDELDTVAEDPRVRAVRWMPTYHDYSLARGDAVVCFRAIAARRLRLLLTVRLVDERHEYHGLHLRPWSRPALRALLRKVPEVPVLLTGLTRPEIAETLPDHPQVLADVAFAEWDRTVERLLEAVAARQLVFGSLSPLLIAAANAAKVTSAQLAPPERVAIARGNLTAFLAHESLAE